MALEGGYEDSIEERKTQANVSEYLLICQCGCLRWILKSLPNVEIKL